MIQVTVFAIGCKVLRRQNKGSTQNLLTLCSLWTLYLWGGNYWIPQKPIAPSWIEGIPSISFSGISSCWGEHQNCLMSARYVIGRLRSMAASPLMIIPHLASVDAFSLYHMTYLPDEQMLFCFSDYPGLLHNYCNKQQRYALMYIFINNSNCLEP